MKICEILSEVVIDFNKFRQARSKPIETKANLSQHDNTLARVKDNLELLLDYIRDIKGQVRLPHFTSFNMVFQYLEFNLAYDEHDTEAWYHALQPKDKAMIDMIAHHANRLLKVLNTIEEKVNDFIKSVPKTIGMPNMVRHLQNSIDHEKSILRELEQLINS